MGCCREGTWHLALIIIASLEEWGLSDPALSRNDISIFYSSPQMLLELLSVNYQLALQNGSTTYLAMDDYILVKSRHIELVEVVMEDDVTVSLDMLRCHLGPQIVS